MPLRCILVSIFLTAISPILAHGQSAKLCRAIHTQGSLSTSAASKDGLTDQDREAFYESLKHLDDTPIELRISMLESMAWQKQNADRLGLSREEHLAVLWYTTDGFGVINDFLRSNNLEKIALIRPIERALNSALSKAPSHQKTVWRHVDPKDLPPNLKINDVFVDQGYLSTSKNRDWRNIEIQGHSGRDISRLAFFDEGEILFAPGTRFRVLDVRPDGTLFLQELP